MKSAVTAVVTAVLLSVAACAPVIEGGPPMALPIGLQETAQAGSVTLSTGWLDAEEDFALTFSAEIHEELRRCMWGTVPINVRVHIDEMERAGRLETLLTGEGSHTLGALLGDRQMMVSEEFGRAVCEQAFGRNPRDRGLHNATGG
jgi:hypothetical protein